MKFDESSLYNIKSDLDGTRCSLFDLATWKNGLAFKKIDFSETGRPVIKIAELNNGINSNTSFTQGNYGEDVYIRWDDLLFSWSGNPQTSIDVFRYRLQDGWLNQHIFKVTANEELVTKDFLYYVLKFLKPYFTQIATNKQTTGLGHVTIADLKRMSLVVPSKEVQNQIVSILKAIDDKIEINTNINENLEEQALALFRQFFMDFAPYGGIAPSDWTEVSLDDVCTRITDGSHYSPADAPDSPYPMYSVKDMETYGFNPSSCKHISEEDFRKMQKGDCVPLLNDILVAKDGSYLKEIFICSEAKDEAVLSSIAIFRPDTNIIMPEILLYLLKQPSVRKDVGDNYVSGSALPRIVLKDFKKYRFMLPPMDEQLKIGSVLHAIRMQTKTNIDEIQCLSSTRDALLPKLMSGELDVSSLDR